MIKIQGGAVNAWQIGAEVAYTQSLDAKKTKTKKGNKIMKNKSLKTILILATIMALLASVTTEAMTKEGFSFTELFGNNDMNITIEQAGGSNIYDLNVNVSTTNDPLFTLYNGVDYLSVKSFGNDMISYYDAAGVVQVHQEVWANNGKVATEQYIESLSGVNEDVNINGVILVIRNGIIVDVRNGE